MFEVVASHIARLKVDFSSVIYCRKALNMSNNQIASGDLQPELIKEHVATMTEEWNTLIATMENSQIEAKGGMIINHSTNNSNNQNT